MSLQICSVLVAFRPCLYQDILFLHAILKTSKFVFLHLRFFLERMGITVVPTTARFSLTFFNLMGATFTNVLEKIVPMLLVILSSSSVVMGT